MYELSLVKLIASRLNEGRLRMQVVAGPRQVGKTTAVKQALRHYGKPFTYRLAEGLGIDPLAWLESEWQDARIQAKSLGEYLLVIDEIQKVVGWSELVKRLWDEDTFEDVPLKVLILGSSRLLLQRGLNESLEGRFEMIGAWHWSYADMHRHRAHRIQHVPRAHVGRDPAAAPHTATRSARRARVDEKGELCVIVVRSEVSRHKYSRRLI